MMYTMLKSQRNWIVTIGCRRFAFSTKKRAMEFVADFKDGLPL